MARKIDISFADEAPITTDSDIEAAQNRVLTVSRLLKIVGNQCDGARADDGHGFSGYDAHTGNDLCAKLSKDWFYPTQKQFNFIKKLIWKYRSQIMGDVIIMEEHPSKASAERAFQAYLDAAVYAEAPEKKGDGDATSLYDIDPDFVVEHDTGRATLFLIKGEKVWIPNACIWGANRRVPNNLLASKGVI